MQERLGETYPAFLASYETPPVKGLRVNTLKLTREAFSALAPAEFRLGDEIGGSGFYTEGEKLGAHPYHFMGLFYMQEPSAMQVGELAGDIKGKRVLDLCAAPGGKTTHIAQKMGGEGVLIANEIDYGRAKILSENVERMGISNCAVVSASPETLAEKFPAYFDLILVDAPCSGEGMFKKEPNAIPEWSEENVKMCAARQKGILENAAKMLRAGGKLVYSTCTFAEEEDEWQIDGFLAAHPDFSRLMQRKLYPHEFNGEGQFVAMLSCPPPASGRSNAFCGKSSELSARCDTSERIGGANGDRGQDSTCPRRVGVGVRPRQKPFPIHRNVAAERAFAAFCADFFGGFVPEGDIHTLADGRMYLVPEGMPDLTGVPLLRVGVALGEWDGKIFKPAHALAMAFGEKAKKKLPLTTEEARRYLRGETLPCDAENGWTVLLLDGFPLGLGKAVAGTVKNHYPKSLRLRD